MFDLSGKRALVTGSSRGIGKSIAIALAKAGADVLVHGRSNTAKAEAVAEEIRALGGDSRVYAADMAKKQEIEAMFAQIEADYGHIDILVNNAAILSRVPLLEMEYEEWERIVMTNSGGYFLCTKLAAKMMKAGGRIVNISSVSEYQAAPGRVHYCASKGAIKMLTRGAALEFAPLGITVNAVLPGSIHTDFNNDVLSDPTYYQNALNGIPAGRLGKADDIGGAVVFLASKEASFVSGAEIVVDGAMTVK